MKPIDTLESLPRAVVLGGSLILVFVIGFLDAINGWDISLFLFYALPILLVAWSAGRRPAMACALLCGLAWFWANYETQPYSAFRGYVWAAFNRTMYFLFVAIGGA